MSERAYPLPKRWGLRVKRNICARACTTPNRVRPYPLWALAALVFSGCAVLRGGTVAPAAYNVQTDQIVFRGVTPFVPGAFDRGVWYEVQSCLQAFALSPDSIRWGVAEYIVDVRGKQLLWGVNAIVHWDEGAVWSIVVDRRVRYSARVLSHEIVHAIGEVPDGDWKLDACDLDDGPYILPLRPLTDEQVRLLTTTSN